VIESMFD